MAGGKVKKGFFFYIFLFAAFVLGFFCILATIMVFNPGKDIYGINLVYKSYSKKVDYYNLTGTETSIEDCNFTNIVFDSNITDFKIKYSTTDSRAKVVFDPDFNSFVREANQTFAPIITCENNTLFIKMQEPEIVTGLSKEANIIFEIPHGRSFSAYNFDITTTSGYVEFGDSDLNNPFSVSSLKVKTGSGSIDLYKNLDIISGDVNLQTNTGDININTTIKNNLNIINKKSRLKVNANVLGNVSITNTDVLKANFQNVEGNIYLNSNDGYLTAKEINSLNCQLNCENTNITINTVKQDLIAKTTSGDVEIDNVENDIDILTISGDVEIIQNSTAATTIKTTSGDIETIFTKIGTVDLNSKSGEIEISTYDGLAYALTYQTEDVIRASWLLEPLSNQGLNTVYFFGANESTTSKITAITSNEITLTQVFRN